MYNQAFNFTPWKSVRQIKGAGSIAFPPSPKVMASTALAYALVIQRKSNKGCKTEEVVYDHTVDSMGGVPPTPASRWAKHLPDAHG